MNYRRIIQIAVLTLVIAMMTASPVLAQANLPYTTNLIIGAGETAADIGDLTINYDGTVTFQIDEGAANWRLAATQLYVGDEPPVKIKPDKFPYKHEGLGGIASDVYNIDFTAADLNGDGIVYIAARAEVTTQVVHPKNGKTIIAEDTAWAQGDAVTGKGKNWMTYFSVILVTLGPVG